MKKSIHVRFFIGLFLLMSMLSPVSVFAFTDGKKHFSAGMKHEDTEQWDKAVEEFALAVADSPKNPEFRLHLTRALFNASQMFMKKGTTAAKEKDYEKGQVVLPEGLYGSRSQAGEAHISAVCCVSTIR